MFCCFTFTVVVFDKAYLTLIVTVPDMVKGQEMQQYFLILLLIMTVDGKV